MITKTINANGSNGLHKFALRVSEDTTSGNSSFMGYSFILSPIQTGYWSGWGNKISYKIKIGDNTFNGTIPDYDGSSTIILSSGSNIEIPHNSDGTKTINISFSVTDTTGQSYTCGNASNSSNMVLSVLHKKPEIIDVNIVEKNTLLTSVGVDDDYVVANLSIKEFTIDVETYDGATVTKYEVINGNKVYDSATNVVRVDFQKNELVTRYNELLEREVADLYIRITDSLGGVLQFVFPYTYIIPYTKPSIEKTSTSIKRKTGWSEQQQKNLVLTDNFGVLNFVGTCYKGNDAVGNNNNPTVQYKIWSANESEPSTYNTLTTPNIANVTIKDFEIGNLLYTESYNYKIRIYDVFFKEETTITIKVNILPTGVSVWSEYKDRVDFLKITQGGISVATFVNIEKEKEIATNEFLNGKRIYKKHFTGKMPTTSKTTTVLFLYNFDATQVWIDESLSFLTSVATTLPTNFYTSENDYLRMYVRKNEKSIVYNSGVDMSSWDYSIVLAYTKD